MPLYGFQPQFAEAIKSGTKRQTIRHPRKRPTKAGETLRLYTGLRTKNCRFLCEAACVSITPVEIARDHIVVNGERMGGEELQAMARADGFASAKEFL